MGKFFKAAYYVIITLLVLVALLLVLTVFPISKTKLMVVLSGSMEPKIHTGSIVAVTAMDSYHIGDVITYGKSSATETPTTHRVVDMRLQAGQPVYTTKGDANNANDGKEVTQSEIIGKVDFSIPHAGYAVSFVKKPLGFMLLVIVPAIIIIYEEIRKIAKEISESRKRRQNLNLSDELTPPYANKDQKK